jgi:hypothetical protein
MDNQYRVSKITKTHPDGGGDTELLYETTPEKAEHDYRVYHDWHGPVLVELVGAVWTSGSGGISLVFTQEQLGSVPDTGRQDSYIESLSYEPTIQAQTEELSDEDIIKELSEHGAEWEPQTDGREVNILRLLWIAVNDIKEDGEKQ